MTATKPNAFDRLLSELEACQQLGVSRATLRRGVEKGLYPSPVRVSTRRIAFRQTELSEFIAALPRAA